MVRDEVCRFMSLICTTRWARWRDCSKTGNTMLSRHIIYTETGGISTETEPSSVFLLTMYVGWDRGIEG